MIATSANPIAYRNRKMANSSTFSPNPYPKINGRVAQLNRFHFIHKNAAENPVKQMVGKRAMISQSDILGSLTEQQHISSVFGKLDSLARHIPAIYEVDQHSQNHQNHLQSPFSKDLIGRKGVGTVSTKIKWQENGLRMDKNDQVKQNCTEPVKGLRSWKEAKNYNQGTAHQAIVTDNLKLLQSDNNLFLDPSLRQRQKHDGDSTNSGSGNGFKAKKFDFLKKRKEREQDGGMMSSASLKQLQPLQTLKKSNIFWPLATSPVEQKSFSMRKDSLQFLGVSNNKQANCKESDKDMSLVTEFKKKPAFLSQIIKSKEELKGKKVTNKRDFTIEDFQILDKLGKGSLAEVYLAMEKSLGFMCVIKKMSKKHIKELKLEQQIIRQIKIQSYLNHCQVTSIYGYFHDENHLYLILELLPDGSLQQVKKKRKLPQRQTVDIIKQVAEGLKYMHEEFIIHRDLKPQNLFTNQGYIKIGDFGCSIYNREALLRKTLVGSLQYFAPEQLCKEGYSQKIDSWSLGILTYELLYGKSPFVEDIKKIILGNEVKAELSSVVFPEVPVISEQAKQFMIRLLETDPDNRMDMDAVLAHPFLCIGQKRQKQDFRMVGMEG